MAFENQGVNKDENTLYCVSLIECAKEKEVLPSEELKLLLREQCLSGLA